MYIYNIKQSNKSKFKTMQGRVLYNLIYFKFKSGKR